MASNMRVPNCRPQAGDVLSSWPSLAATWAATWAAERWLSCTPRWQLADVRSSAQSRTRVSQSLIWAEVPPSSQRVSHASTSMAVPAATRQAEPRAAGRLAAAGTCRRLRSLRKRLPLRRNAEVKTLEMVRVHKKNILLPTSPNVVRRASRGRSAGAGALAEKQRTPGVTAPAGDWASSSRRAGAGP